MQARIDSFERELFAGDDEMHLLLVENTMRVIHDYLQQYEDADIQRSVFKIKEAIFYLINWRES